MITKKQTLRIICFLVLVIFLDQVGGRILKNLYFSQRAGQNANLNFALRDCKADILIFGNSRAQHHYDSRIISDGLRMTCYNAGQDGGHSILLQYAQIKIITERYSPKIIILEFSPENIVYNSDFYDKLSILLPYYSEYPSIRPLVLLRSKYENFKLLSAIYPFNSDIINIIRFNSYFNSSSKKNIEGYIPITNKIMKNEINKVESEKNTKPVVDTNMVIALSRIIDLCKQKNIDLYIFNSPFFNNSNTNKCQSKSIAKLSLSIINQKSVSYYDFSNDSTFERHMEWFADFSHLNKTGATVFSNLVLNIIKENPPIHQCIK